MLDDDDVHDVAMMSTSKVGHAKKCPTLEVLQICLELRENRLGLLLKQEVEGMCQYC